MREEDNHWLTRLEESIISILLAAMVLLVFAQVVARYVFNSGILWALEATTTLFAWLILFGASYAVKAGLHIGIDLFVLQLPKRWRKAAAVFAALLAALYALILLDASVLASLGLEVNARGGALDYIEQVYYIGVEMTDLPIPQWVAYLILPLGLALLFLRCLQAAWEIFRGKREMIISVHRGMKSEEVHRDDVEKTGGNVDNKPDDKPENKTGG